MKSLKWLISSILTDVSVRCDTDTQRDYDYVISRVEHEGLSFLTITLPTLSTALERGLEVGRFEPREASAFKHSQRGTLPLFLGGLFVQVFDGHTGLLLESPSVEAILCIRQVCLMWKKVSIACSEERTENAIQTYLECENDVARLPEFSTLSHHEDHKVDVVRQVAGILWHRIGSLFANARRTDSLVPKHGPGATAERISGNRKYTLHTWHSRLQEFFPLDLFGLPNGSWVGDPDVEKMNIVEPDAEMPVRVITVPKTLKTPRVIAVEPVCMQYAQQALLEFLVKELERGWVTSDHVNFTNQDINQQLALFGSQHGTIATLDLKEASDRVSMSLVELVFRVCPELLGALTACRSTRAKLPNGEIVPLKKFASMGSATCFPVEAMVFFTLAVAASLPFNKPVTEQRVKDAALSVWVYGDDIVVPVNKVLTVLEYFEYFGLKVNQNKSFWTGKFRESCGMDAYDGTRVTPVYLRELPQDGRSKRGLVSLVSFANQLYERGWWRSAREVRRWIEDRYGPLPHVLHTSPGLGWTSFLGSYSVEKWDPKHQVYRVKTYVPKPVKHHDELNGRGALLKFFLSRGKPETKEDFHKSVRRGDVHVNRRWVRPH